MESNAESATAGMLRQGLALQQVPAGTNPVSPLQWQTAGEAQLRPLPSSPGPQLQRISGTLYFACHRASNISTEQHAGLYPRQLPCPT